MTDTLATLIPRDAVCPMPQIWNRLWAIIAEGRSAHDPESPPAPLILAAWHHSTDADKRARFQLHLQWARDHDLIDAVRDLLIATTPKDWFTRTPGASA